MMRRLDHVLEICFCLVLAVSLSACSSCCYSVDALIQQTPFSYGGGPRSRQRLRVSMSSSSLSDSSSSNESDNNAAAANPDNYFRHWQDLLQEEHHAAVLELKERRSRWSQQRLQSSGISMGGDGSISAEPDSEVLGEKIVRIYNNQNNIQNWESSGGGGGSRSRRSRSSGSNWRDVYNRGDVLVMTPIPSAGSSSGFFSSAASKRTGRRLRNRRGSSNKAVAAAAVVPRDVSVVDVGKDWMTVSIGSSSNWPAGLWESRKHAGDFSVRLDRTVSMSTLLAQTKALDLVRRNQAGRAARLLVETTSYSYGGDSDKTILNATAARVFDRNAENAAARVPQYLRYLLEDDDNNNADSSQQSPTGVLDTVIAQSIQKAKKNADSFFQPNSSQEAAIAWALGRSLSLIRGPPGTGKTVCAALLISSALGLTRNTQTLAQQQPPTRVLAVAHSNGAADVLLQALLDMGVPAIRIGRPAVVSPSVRHRTVVALADKHPEVQRRRAEMADMMKNTDDKSSNNDKGGDSRGMAAYEMSKCLRDVRDMLATTAPVVVASCIGAHQLLLEQETATTATKSGSTAGQPLFPLVVLDEAAQSTEPALICALAAARAQQVVFVGDTKQLPPTVASENRALRESSLGISPMARLESRKVGQQTLKVQYRMPPALLEFPSQYFYDGLVTCNNSTDDDAATTDENSLPPAGFPWPNPTLPLAFLQLGPDLETAHDMGGKSNPTEADLVVQVVLDLVAGNEVAAKGIAVISPYSKQVQLIRTLLSSRNLQDVRVGTVDSFQGQEKEVVVFSAVRSNSMSELGFLRDPRRLCVALTRAKRGLIVIGDPLVLQTSRPWSALLDSCRRRGCVLRKEDLEVDRKTQRSERKQEKMEEPLTDTALFAALEASLEDEEDGLQDLYAEITL